MPIDKPLVFLAYVSRVACALDDIDAILDGSRRRNAERDVTGLLLHDARWFFQVLEGPPAAVGALVLRIAHDARHRDMRLLAAPGVEFRLFSKWSMKSAKFEDGRRTIASTLASLDGLAPEQRAAALQALAMEFMDGQNAMRSD
jgi:hypothetical protein